MTETWNEAVLDVLQRQGTVMSLKEIYEAMECRPIVTSHHKETWGNQPNYHHWIRSTLASLKRHGKVQHVGKSLYASNQTELLKDRTND